MRDFPAPAFFERHHELAGPERPACRQDASPGSALTCSITNASDRCTSSQRTSVRASTSPAQAVATGCGQSGTPRRGGRAAHPAAPRRHGCDAHESQVHAGLSRHDADAFEPGLTDAFLSIKRPLRSALRPGSPTGAHVGHHFRRMSNRTPPGRMRPRPYRLPVRSSGGSGIRPASARSTRRPADRHVARDGARSPIRG